MNNVSEVKRVDHWQADKDEAIRLMNLGSFEMTEIEREWVVDVIDGMTAKEKNETQNKLSFNASFPSNLAYDYETQEWI